MVGDLSRIITPPYDVISLDEQAAFYERDPYNIIRIEYGRDLPDDRSHGSDKYSRAASTLEDWTRRGILVREERSAFYLTEHRFPHEDGTRSYWGLMAAVRVEDFATGQIRPTEVIMKGPAADRLQLLRACRANISPIMGIFNSDKDDVLSFFPGLDPAAPAVSATDDWGVVFNLHVVTDEADIGGVVEFFARTPVYIADGHHRYTTALAFRDEQAAGQKDPPADFLLMTLISSSDPGLMLFPTHRMIRGTGPDKMAGLRRRLDEYFHIRELPFVSRDRAENLKRWTASLAEASVTGPALGFYGLEPGKYLLMVPRDSESLRRMLTRDEPEAWRNLDVSLLHGVVLPELMGIGNGEDEKEDIAYSPDGLAILDKVDSGEAQMGIFLNPVPVSSVIDVADAGVRMPPKSTYFYPKTPAGLVLNPLY